MTGRARGGRRPWRHLILFAVGYPPVCLALLVVLVQLALNSDAGRQRVEALLRQAIPGTIRYERLFLTLPPLRLHVYGVELIHPQTGEALITAQEVHASLAGSPLALLGPDLSLSLDDVQVVDASLKLLFDEENYPSLPDLFVARDSPPSPPDEPPARVRISLQGVAVDDLEYLQQMPATGLSITASRVRVRGEFLMDSGEMSIKADVALPRGRVAIGDPRQPDAPPFLDIPIDRLDVRGFTWRGWGFGFRRAEVTSAGITAQATGALALDEPMTFAGAAQAVLPLHDWFLAPQLGGLLHGTAAVSGVFWGSLDHAYGSWRLAAPRLQVAGLALDELRASGELDGQQVVLDGLQTSVLGGALDFVGRLRLFDGWLAGQARLRDIDPTPLLPPGEITRLLGGRISGRIAAQAEVWGAGPLQGDVDLALTLQRSQPTGLPLPGELRLTANGSYASGRARLRRVVLAGGGHQLGLRGLLEPAHERLDLEVSLTTGELGPWLRWAGLPDAAARAEFASRLQGTFTNPAGTGRLRVAGLRYQTHPLGEATADLQLARGTLTVPRLRLAGGDLGELTLAGKIGLWHGRVDQLLADPTLQLTGELRQVRLARLAPAHLRLQGAAEADFDLSGSVRRLDLQVALRTGPTSLRGLRLEHLALESTLRRHGARFGLQVPRLHLALQDGGSLEASGKLSEEQEVQLDLRLEGLPLAEVDRILGLGSGLAGRATLGLHAEGPLHAPQGAGDLIFRELRRRGEEEGQDLHLGDASLHFAVGEDQLLQVTARQAFGHFDLTATLPLTLDAPTPVDLDRAEARLAFHELTLAELLPGFTAQQQVSGVFSGELAARLRNGRPAMDLQLQRFALDTLGQSLTNGEQPIRLGFDGQRLTVQQLALQTNQHTLTVAGTLDLDEEGELLESRLNLHARGALELAVLRPLLPDLPRLAGQIEFGLALTGRLGAPQLIGHLQLDGARFQVSALDQELLLERGRILFSPGIVELPASAPLVGRLGRQGAFSLAARVELPELLPLAIPKARATLRAERLRLSFPEEGLQLTLDVPGLELTAADLLEPNRRLELGGEVRLASGQFVRSFTDPEALAQAFRSWFEGLEQAQSRSLPEEHPARALRLRNLKITGEQGAFLAQIQAAILSLKLHVQPDLALNGALDSLRVSGTVDLGERDTLSLMDREFTVTRAEINFDGSTNPLVDLEAEAQVIAIPLSASEQNLDQASEEDRTYTITLYLKGRVPDDLEKFELTSPQTTDQRELWTLILLGYRYSDLSQAGQKGDVGSEVLLSSALQILSQKISQEALKEFRLVDQLMLLSKHQDIQIQVSKKVLGGKLELLGSGTFSGAQSQGSVGAKLYLRERLFLEFATTPGNEQNPMSGRLGWQVPLE